MPQYTLINNNAWLAFKLREGYDDLCTVDVLHILVPIASSVLYAQCHLPSLGISIN